MEVCKGEDVRNGFNCPGDLIALVLYAASERSSLGSKRLRLISSLGEQLQEWHKESAASPEMAETLIWYEQERLLSSIATAYTHGALAYNAAGREHAALKLAVEFGMLNSGPDDLDVQAMQGFMENPQTHWSWGDACQRLTMSSVPHVCELL
ncbi:hypothetical protein JB92DRAFT_3044114 [Gautieria morchelliformis]|nr:hypothetical protein JB92DRAFT_3044114 [Gautieria morchelliformis]